MKSPLLKTVRNFVTANLCVLLPLWMIVFGWMPHQVKVHLTVNGKKPVSLVMDGRTLLGKDGGDGKGRIWGFNLPDGVEWKQLEFILPGDLGPESVRKIEFRKWPGFTMSKEGTGLSRTADGTNQYAFPQPRFDSMGFASAAWAAAFWGIEILFLSLSWLFARRHREERVATLLPSVAGVALLLALLLQVVLPLQSFLSNRSSFPFSLADLGGAMAVRFFLALGGGTAVLLVLARCFGRWILAPVLAFAVCAYLESGVLSIGFPDLKGNWDFFDNPFRARWDAAVWIGVFALAGGMHPFLKRRYGLAALCVAGLSLASLLDVKVEPKVDASKLMVDDFSPIETVIRSVKYSSAGNVMVFVIDSLERGVAHAIVEDPEEGAGLKEKFAGFTEYIDNVGAANSSLLAIANVFTGAFPENANVFDYFVSVYSGRSVLKDYLEEGFAVSMATDALGYGYCNRPLDSDGGAAWSQCFRVPGTGGNSWTLAGFNRFRWMPFMAKAPYVKRVELNARTGTFSNTEQNIYPILRDADIPFADRKSFLFVHTHGVHIPVLLDRAGTRLPEAGTTDQACVEMGVYIMKQLAELFEAYREKGIYDNSMIIVMADHGPHDSEKSGKELSVKEALPFLWIKPVGARHAFRTSSLPTCHAQLAGLLRAASKRVLTEGEIEGLMQADVRRYCWLRGGMGPEYTNAEVERGGNMTLQKGVLPPQAVDAMRPPVLSRIYSLARNEMGRNKLDIVFSNVSFWPSPTLKSQEKGMKLLFRAPDPGKRYAVRLLMSCCLVQEQLAENATMEFRQTGRQLDWTSLPAQRRAEYVLHDLRPLQDGMVEIEGQRGEELSTTVRFIQFVLEEEPEDGEEAEASLPGT